jgi:LAO/AO transport system kinase
VEELAAKILAGDRRAAARAISMVENNDPNKRAFLSSVYSHTGRAYVIGITGAPGSGKSTLADRLIDFYRRKELQVGVIAVDPTSPFTGGAILGDRIRMQEHALDPGVFIRSMGSRGSLGGLSRATREAVTVLDAMGRDIILVETVGVGQSEVDIVKMADTTLVVLTPAGGDSVQTMKAGIMEIADIFVVNKADMEGADRTVRDVQMMLDLNQSFSSRPAASLPAYGSALPPAAEKKARAPAWRPPVVATRPLQKEGLEGLFAAIQEHRSYLEAGERLKEFRRQKARLELLELVEHEIKDRVLAQVIHDEEAFENLLEQIMLKTLDPYSAAGRILETITL